MRRSKKTYRVWFENDCAMLVESYTESGAKIKALRLSREQGENCFTIVSVECLD